MRTLILLGAIAITITMTIAPGCMDFSWPDNQINCQSNASCPSGMYCDLEVEKCIEGFDPTAGEPCENVSDCSATECGVASCDARGYCQWSLDDSKCGPGLLCDEQNYSCTNALCPGAGITQPALLSNELISAYSAQVASSPDGYTFSYSDHTEFGWTLTDTDVAVQSIHKATPTFGVGRHSIIALPEGRIALIYSRELSGDIEVLLQMLDSRGLPAGSEILISDEEAAPMGVKASYAPEAAYTAGADGSGGTIAISWLYADFDGTGGVSDVSSWGAVFDVGSLAVSPSFPLVNLSAEIDETSVSAFDEVFISSAVTANGKIYLRAFNNSGPKGGAPILVVAANAHWPHAIAWDSAETLGILWRHMSSEGEIARFAAVTAEGALADRVQNPVDLGPTLLKTKDYERTSVDLVWAPPADAAAPGHWLAAFDGVPGQPGGDQEIADVQLAIIPAALDPLPEPINISDYSVASSFAPAIALGQSTANLEVLIAWHDRRPFSFDVDTDTDWIPEFPQGIFYSVLNCP